MTEMDPGSQNKGRAWKKDPRTQKCYEAIMLSAASQFHRRAVRQEANVKRIQSPFLKFDHTKRWGRCTKHVLFSWSTVLGMP